MVLDSTTIIFPQLKPKKLRVAVIAWRLPRQDG
jgi:hypothetical protein